MNEVQTKDKPPIIVSQMRSEQEQPKSDPSTSPNCSLRSFRAEAEVHAISRALERTGWNRKRAAQLLSISYRGLLYKIRQHNITRDAQGSLDPFAQKVKAG
jgi:DNA-binding NtrC family response regulator